jgi:hypothetical protein
MSSNFETLFNAALAKYIKQTGKDLRNHPLAFMIDSCDSPDSILDIFKKQSEVFDEFRRGDTKLFNWLRPVVKVLHALSSNEVLSDSACLVSPAPFPIIRSVYLNTVPQVFPPAKAVFSGIGILLSVGISLLISTPLLVTFGTCQTAKDVKESYDALVDIFECIENFLRRLSIYTEIPPTPAMTEMVIKIMVELISVLALATKQINQGRFSMSDFAYNHAWLTCGREIRKETFGRKGHRISASKA